MFGPATSPVRASAIGQATSHGDNQGPDDVWPRHADAVSLLFASAINGDVEGVQGALASLPPLYVTLGGKTALHMAVQQGHLDVVQVLIGSGLYPYNLPDDHGKLPADYCESRESTLWRFLVNEGLRTELLRLALAEADQPPAGSENGSRPDMLEQSYLRSSLDITSARILDGDRNAVMMSWEGPIMRRHAELLCTSPGLSVLNVGFGMGIIDEAFQALKPSSHTIIEAHPDVLRQMRADRWHERKNVTIREGRWQDVIPELVRQGHTYDVIFFDTFSGDYSHLRAFHMDYLLDLLTPGSGRYSFFHGLAGTNAFLHEVFGSVAEIELRDLGLHTEWEDMAIDHQPHEWEGAQRIYYSLGRYNLPICGFAM